MAQRRHHYEQAFEVYLRSRRIPYVAVDEARKALLPEGSRLAVADDPSDTPPMSSLKSFDFVVYGDAVNLLVDVKGRRVGRNPPVPKPGKFALRKAQRGRLESWVTNEDVASLRRWETLFGPSFRAVFLFIYWCDAQPPDALFQEVFDCRGRWYAVRAVTLDDYAKVMKVRSPRWGTVDVPSEDFEKVSGPFTGVGTFS
ncbi:MAG TPA: HYExAFE family protein [Phycisphaerales bacterium]|nr:HYExAFE family protein [Phycisphaerales bacterium]